MRSLRIKKSLLLIGLFIVAIAVGGCFGNVGSGRHFNETPGGESPDIGAPTANIPETDDQLFTHVRDELLVKPTSRHSLEALATDFNATLDTKYLEHIGWARLRFSNLEQPLTDVMRKLNADPRVAHVQANHTEYSLPYVRGPELETRVRPLATNDEFFATEQYGPQKIHAPAAWAQEVTGKGTWIAIIDTGVDSHHPDLLGKLLSGYNPDLDSADTSDFDGHGTHVAGSAAAIAFNEIGIAGVAPDAKIMPLRVFNPVDGNTVASDYAIAVALLIAGNPSLIGLDGLPPADVANLSLGGPVYSQLILDAVNYASDRDVVVVAAMGNSYNQAASYPAAYPRVVAVGATDEDDAIAPFSTTGRHNSVTAPGVDVYSTLPGGGYGRLSGTSMAAPHVAGAVSLLRQARPDMRAHHIKELLEDTADSLGDGRAYGHGRINVAQALLGADGFATKYGMLEVYVHDGYGRGGESGGGIYEADVILWRAGEEVGNVRTGGAWDAPNMMFDGMAWFYELEPGQDYSLTVRLDAEHPLHYTDEEIVNRVDNITIEKGKMTNVRIGIRLP